MSVEDLERKYSGGRLLEAMCEQDLVDHDEKLASALIDVGQKVVRIPGSVLYEKGEETKGIYFILHGRIEVSRDGQPLGQLPRFQAVGSWPLLYADPTYHVTTRALEDTVLLLVGVDEFHAVGSRFPLLWKELARTQADRLKGTHEYFLPRNPVPQVLIGSADEALSVARKLGKLLEEESGLDVKLWTEVFPAGESTLESLTSGLDNWDFAAFFLTPDDEVICRDVRMPAPRDNIVFEAGLCMGRLGRMRTLLLQPQEPKDLKVPTDLKGITRLFYADDPKEVLEKLLEKSP